MCKRLNIVVVLCCFTSLLQDVGCQSGEVLAADIPPPMLAQAQPNQGTKGAPGVAGGSVEIEKFMAELRSKFAGKNDDEIVQVLRSYASPDRSADRNAATWLAKRLDRAKKQRKAIEAVEKLRGGVFYDYQKGSSICRPAGEPRAPGWLRRLLGDQFFADVVGIGFSGDNVANEALANLRAFPNLEFVMLNCPKVDNGGLAHLVGFPHLNLLEIRETRVSEDAIMKLARALPEECAIEWNGRWVRAPKPRP
jgi:hypothetical protein